MSQLTREEKLKAFGELTKLPGIQKASVFADERNKAMDQNGSPTTLGTGFFVSSDGLVVTNFHVINGTTSLAAVNNNGAIFLFERIVAQPAGVDLAILQFRATDVPFLTLGKSRTAHLHVRRQNPSGPKQHRNTWLLPRLNATA